GSLADLLAEGLALLDRAGRRVPHWLLPTLLDVQTDELRSRARAVIGERGVWLASHSERWNWATESDGVSQREIERTWQEGTMAARWSVQSASGGSHWQVHPLETVDAAAQRDGLHARPPQGMGPRAYWLTRVIAAVPITHWEAHLGATPESLLASALSTEWAE